MKDPIKDYSILPLKGYLLTSFHWFWTSDPPGAHWLWIEPEGQLFNGMSINSIPICLVVTPCAPIVVSGGLSNARW